MPKGGRASNVLRLPKLDNAMLLKNEKDIGGYQFAHVVPFTTQLIQGAGQAVNNGRIFRTTIESEGALSLSFTFSPFYFPEGSELYIVSETQTLGAFGAHNNWDAGIMTVFPIKGEWATIEYYEPENVKERARLQLSHVAHGYKPLDFGDSGSCNNNVECDSGEWANQIRSVGMLTSSFGSRFCSGALVNNAAGDGRQLFLTANHCGPAAGDLVVLNYQSPTCTPNQDGSTDHTVGQMTPLTTNYYSDFALVELGETIPSSWNVFLSGISGENVAPTKMVGIHHPSGDIKKITYANKAGLPDKWTAAEPGNWHWRITSWDDGTTEPGSSGSPLFDQNNRVVGQLHGGVASCSNNGYDSYGATWASWSNGLGEHIDPNGSGNLLINGTDLNALRKF